MASKDLRSRAYFMTLNNYSTEELEKMKAAKTVYHCVCEEICPTTETPHLHAWMYFKSAKYFSKMKKDYPRANIQRSIADRGVDAREYCLGQVKHK